MSTSSHTSLPAQTIFVPKSGPGCLVQALWFLFIGWWLGGLAIALAWLLNITIIGLPLGMAVLNNIPRILALQSPERIYQVIPSGGTMAVREISPPQINFIIRALYFILIGWWFSGIWLGVAYFLCFTILLMPLGLWMFRLTPTMTTLRRY